MKMRERGVCQVLFDDETCRVVMRLRSRAFVGTGDSIELMH